MNAESAASTASRDTGGPSLGVSSPVDVVGARGRAEADGGAIGLPVGQVELDDARAAAQEDRQDARGERVERPAVPDALRRRQAPDQRHDVVRGRDRSACRRRGCRRALDRVTDGPRSAPDRVGEARRLGQDRRVVPGRRESRPSRRPHARGPLPRTRPVSTVASTPPGLVRTLIRVDCRRPP